MNRFLKNIFLWMACTFFSLFTKLNSKKVLFRAYNGLRYACNPRAISEKLHELAPEFEIVWCLRNLESASDLPDYVRVVKKGSLAEYRELFTAKFWVFNAGIVIPYKRKGQLFMDTWHGDRAFKCVDIATQGKEKLADAYKHADAILSGSDYGDRVIREAMNFKGEILHVGSPRDDVFFSDFIEKAEGIKKVLNLAAFDNLVTFAPTFRGKGDGVEPLDFSKLLNQLEERDHQKWGCLIRQHYKVPLQKSWTKDPRIVDVSSYPEMQDLLLISDVVISDYSSLVGDFALLKRPIVLYVPDLDEYKNGRGLYFDLEKSPYKYAKTSSELFDLITNFTADSAQKNCEDILEFYGHVCENGSASEQACKWILKHGK